MRRVSSSCSWPGAQSRSLAGGCEQRPGRERGTYFAGGICGEALGIRLGMAGYLRGPANLDLMMTGVRGR